MGLDDITNPLNQAEGTLKAARGVLRESVGLVKDVAQVAGEVKQYREDRQDDRAIAPSLLNKRATKRVTKRDVKQATAEYDSELDSSMAAAKKVLIEKKRAEEEAAMVWAMSKEERDAYYEEKAAQIERVKAEKLRLIREEDARRERNELIGALVFGVVTTGAVIWGFLAWIAVMKGNGMNWLPGIQLIR
jgi:vacuolar-type H+-ATPase subunit I/STV1